MTDDALPYNPLSKRNLAASIVNKLLHQSAHELPPPNFAGAGLYVLYYTGPFDVYRTVSEANENGACKLPIYVGRAVPKGGRKGLEGFDIPQGQALSRRLKEHADSIRSAENLELDDFRCRWLVVDEVFIRLGESLLISHYQPLWNAIVDGFGNHAPGVGRAAGKKPLWDVIHPGRPWARPLKAAVDVEEVFFSIRKFFAASAVPPDEIIL
jgi:hypothetical protein